MKGKYTKVIKTSKLVNENNRKIQLLKSMTERIKKNEEERKEVFKELPFTDVDVSDFQLENSG